MIFTTDSLIFFYLAGAVAMVVLATIAYLGLRKE